nr:zinc finger, CCHC-type [Tanacetum cinerariifolium]
TRVAADNKECSSRRRLRSHAVSATTLATPRYSASTGTRDSLVALRCPRKEKINYFKSQNTKHKTTKAIWNALKTRHIGQERVQQARLQTLKFEFEMLHMKEDETIYAFTTKLTTLVNKAASLGHTMEDETLVRKLLNAIPNRYLQIVTSIEQYSDLSGMTLEEAIGRLKTYKERIKYKGKQVDNQDRLLFTRYEEQGRRRDHGGYN